MNRPSLEANLLLMLFDPGDEAKVPVVAKKKRGFGPARGANVVVHSYRCNKMFGDWATAAPSIFSTTGKRQGVITRHLRGEISDSMTKL